MSTIIVLGITFLIIITIISFISSAKKRSQGYYDEFGRKIPLDEMKQQSKNQEAELSTLKERLETEKQHSGDVLQRLEQLEQRIKALEKRGPE
jgi:archaellum component FlaC